MDEPALRADAEGHDGVKGAGTDGAPEAKEAAAAASLGHGRAGRRSERAGRGRRGFGGGRGVLKSRKGLEKDFNFNRGRSDTVHRSLVSFDVGPLCSRTR
jgi:hypothetical protein